MADVITRLKVESSEYDQKLSRATQQLQHMEKEVRRTGATFAYADKEEIAFVRSMGSMETKTTSAKGQLREYTDALMQLTTTYRNLSQEEKNSEWGKALAASLDEIKNKASLLKDAMSDVNREIGGMASDTQVFDSLAGGVTGLVSVFQIGQGALQMFGVKNKEAIEAMARLQGAMAVTIGLAKIQAMLQKESAVMIGITTLQRKAATAALNLETAAQNRSIVATKTATVAQKALNAVAKANPYVLLATAIIAVGTALFAFAKSSKDAQKEEEAAQRAAERDAEKNERVGESIGKLIGKYALLKNEWQNLTTVAEKNEWINNNKTAFDELGVSVQNVADAENIFVKNTEKMMDALRLRAQSAALEQNIQKDYEDYYKALDGVIYTEGSYVPMMSTGHGSTNTPSAMRMQAIQYYGLSFAEGEDTYLDKESKTYRLTKSGAEKVNKRNAEDKGVELDVDNALAELISLKEQANAILSEIGIKPANTNQQSIANEILPQGSIAELEQRISKLNKEWKLATTDEERASKKKEIDELTEQLDKLRGKVKSLPPVEVPIKFTEKGISELGRQIKTAMSEAEIGSGAYFMAAENLLDFNTFQNLLKTATEKGVQIDTEWLASLFNDIKIGADVDDESWQALVDKINAQLKDLKLDPIKLDVETGAVSDAPIKTAKATEEGWKAAANAIQTVGGALQQIEDPGAKVAGIIAQAVANIALSFAEAAASPAVTGTGWGWLGFAAAGIATMISSIVAIKQATAGAFANGGVISGNSYSGDNMIANVNSGELILNRAQQNSIAGQLSSNPIGDLRLYTDISGYNLRVVLNNDNRGRGGQRAFYSKIH